MTKASSLDELRLSDLATLLAVRRHLSLAAAAREVGVTTSQVSKAIGRLERQLGGPLLSRSSKGVALTDTGAALVPRLEQVFESIRALQDDATGTSARLLTLAAPSYLASECVTALAQSLPGARIRTLQLAPAHIAALAADGMFELALTVGRPRLPHSWHVEEIGEVRLGLFTSPLVAEALGPGPVEPEALSSQSFVVPTAHSGGQWLTLDDGCPLPITARRRGHETDTVAVALALAAKTNQLCFGPRLAAKQLLETGALAEVPVRGWAVTQRLVLCSNIDRVLSNERKSILEALKPCLDDGR